jgi:hypothetical protein
MFAVQVMGGKKTNFSVRNAYVCALMSQMKGSKYYRTVTLRLHYISKFSTGFVRLWTHLFSNTDTNAHKIYHKFKSLCDTGFQAFRYVGYVVG